VFRVTAASIKFNHGPEGEIFFGPVLFLARLFSGVSLLVLVLFSMAVPLVAQGWQGLGPPGGNVISFAAGADGTAYLGTPDGHVFASADLGERWEIRGRVGLRLDAVVQAIVADSTKQSRLLAAVRFQDSAFGGGVFESVDGGRHWKIVGLAGEVVRTLDRAPSDPQMWVAGARSGVFRSANDGKSWERITPAEDPELQNVDSLAIDPTSPDVIYVGTYHLPWKTTDGGKNWTSIAYGMIDDSDIMSLRIDAKNPRRIFSSACSGIYRSEDAGASWIKLQGIPYLSRRTQQIVQDPQNPGILYAATTAGLWQTADYGESWKRMSLADAVANAVLVLPGPSGSRVLAGMESQGVLLSDDAANSFRVSNDGFSHRVASSLAADPGDLKHLLAAVEGLLDKLWESRDGGLSWNRFPFEVPARSFTHILGSTQGWWISLATGGIAHFDSVKGKWAPINFRERIPQIRPAEKSSHSRSTPPIKHRARIVFPHVDSFLESDGRIVVATDDGLWDLAPEQLEFRRLPAKNIPKSVDYLSATSLHSMLALAKNEIWSGDIVAGNWVKFEPPSAAGRLNWIVDVSRVQQCGRLLGTDHGVFRLLPDGSWQLLSNGLPAIPSLPPAFADSDWFIAMANGGLYHSFDSGSSWQRLDDDSVQGKIAALIAQNPASVVIASQSEGLLRYSLTARGAH